MFTLMTVSSKNLTKLYPIVKMLMAMINHLLVTWETYVSGVK